MKSLDSNIFFFFVLLFFDFFKFYKKRKGIIQVTSSNQARKKLNFEYVISAVQRNISMFRKGSSKFKNYLVSAGQ